MIKYIISHTRKNPKTPFYEAPDHLRNNIDELLDSGKLISQEIIQTKYTKTWINTWSNEQDALDFGKEEMSIKRHEDVDNYNSINHIIKNLHTEKTIINKLK